jgi:sulfonate transport system ATP-binding protein
MPGAGAPPAPEEAVVRVAIAAKRFESANGETVEAVRDLTFAVRPRETVCLIGPSGAGKTTTLRILLGLDRRFEGLVKPDPDALPAAMVFQEPRLLPWRTVEQNIRLALPRRARRQPLDDLIRSVGLLDWQSRYPGELSLGMARRVALARALALQPRLLVLDEPFTSLDDQAAAELRDVVFAAAAERAASVLLVTHNLGEALQVADRILFLSARPARVIGEVALTDAKSGRTRAWSEARRAELARLYPTAVAA